ncbi:MAG: hypothetical protein ACYTG0_17340 [Planctomycetota bacterium]
MRQEGHGSEQPANKRPADQPKPKRLLSLDAYRGFVMLTLATVGLGIGEVARRVGGDFWETLAEHVRHPEWISNAGMGFFCWDMIQPSFMFMVGAAMPFSYARRAREGHGRAKTSRHAITRSIVLVLLAIFLSSRWSEQTEFVFFNVLAQIGLGYYFTYLLMGCRFRVQLAATAGILAGYWALFMLYPVPFDWCARNVDFQEGVDRLSIRVANDLPRPSPMEFRSDSPRGKLLGSCTVQAAGVYNLSEPDEKGIHDVFAISSDDGGASKRKPEWIELLARSSEPIRIEADQIELGSGLSAHFAKNANLAWRCDAWFLNCFGRSEPFTFNRGGYTTLNFLPSIVTMLLGVMAGQLLRSSRAAWPKFWLLVLGGVVCMALAMAAAHTACPIIKRIWTPSWTLFAGAWTLWMLAAFYCVIDVWGRRAWAFPLAVVGMNSILMYMMFQTIRKWTAEQLHVHFGWTARLWESCFGSTTFIDNYGPIVESASVVLVFWLICYWLYRQRVFLRI